MGDRSSDVAGRHVVMAGCYRRGNVALIHRFISSNFSKKGFRQPKFRRVVYRLRGKLTGAMVAGSLSHLKHSVQRSDCCTRRFFPRHKVGFVTVTSGFSDRGRGMVAPFVFTVGRMCLQSNDQGIQSILGGGHRRKRCYTYPPCNCGGTSNGGGLLIPSRGATPIIREVFGSTTGNSSSEGVTRRLGGSGIVPPLGCQILCQSGFDRSNTTGMSSF